MAKKNKAKSKSPRGRVRRPLARKAAKAKQPSRKSRKTAGPKAASLSRMAASRQGRSRSRPVRSAKSKTTTVADAIRELKSQRRSLSAAEKGARLEKLLKRFPSTRTLAKAIGKTEGRIRQLIKVAKAAGTTKVKPAATKDKTKPSPARPDTLGRPAADAHADVPQGLQPVAPAEPHAVEGPDQLPLGGQFIQDTKPSLQPLVQATAHEAEPVAAEAGAEDATPAEGEGPVRGKAASKSAPDYAIKDATAGGKVLYAWMRANIKRRDWPQYIDEFKSVLQWISRQEYSEEVKQVGKVPPGLMPERVIQYCLTESIKEGLETDPGRALKKWFARWTSILLPNPETRLKAVEFAERPLKEPAAQWTLVANAPYLNRPTPAFSRKARRWLRHRTAWRATGISGAS